MKPETLQRLEAEADVFAQEMALYTGLVHMMGDGDLARLLVIAFLRGADTGYTAAKAEDRDP